MTTTNQGEHAPEALRSAEIIRDWCTDCRIPLPSDDECARLVAALTAQPAAAPQGVAYAPSIEDLCARIKAADDAAADRDYMLDSNDCIAVLRGQWKGPMAMDKPDRAPHGQAPAWATPWRSAVLDLIDECPGLTMEQDHWLSRRVKELDFPSAPRPTAQAAPAAGAVAGMPPGISALMCVISSLRDTAHFSDEEGELTDELRTLRDWAMTQAAAPTPAAQADSQPTPVQDYPPLPECQGKIFDDGYWIQNKLGPKHCVMGGAKVWLESQVHKAIDADRAARAPTDSVLEDAVRVYTYKNQPGDNVIAWRFGEACRAANPGGDPIDHGLSLLQKLQEKGYGIVAIDAASKQGGA